MTNLPALVETARAMVADDKGLLAMDESTGTCNRRFAAAGVPQTVALRRAYRELLLRTPGLSTCVSGVILYDETLRQAQADGTPLARVAREAGLLVGIKVDTGAKDLAGWPGERVTEGLDGLRERLHAYLEMGACFAKWRGVVAIDACASDGAGRPSRACIEVNAQALARYAALCQEAGLVPIIEPEVLMDGGHTLERCGEITQRVLRSLFEQLALQGVAPEAVILKPNMVLAGLACEVQPGAADVADATLACLLRVAPAALPGIAFLSGGQPAAMASSRLNAMQAGPRAAAAPGRPAPPWPLTFSFARALQHPALEIWAGREANREAAQQALLRRAMCCRAAVQGRYDAALESR